MQKTIFGIFAQNMLPVTPQRHYPDALVMQQYLSDTFVVQQKYLPDTFVAQQQSPAGLSFLTGIINSKQNARKA